MERWIDGLRDRYKDTHTQTDRLTEFTACPTNAVLEQAVGRTTLSRITLVPVYPPGFESANVLAEKNEGCIFKFPSNLIKIKTH